ncbi:MAG: poly-gamma-glutamate biosynthesis protein, partial [Gammaproteobacteria bacterium]|nr:poly-gamma-glutamate biosynthesis protein [Gammaproteobacteria bacterium]
TEQQPGLNMVSHGSAEAIEAIAQEIEQFKNKEDLVVVSLHWGGNWGYAIEKGQRDFAHALIDKAGADIIHGHSSH